VSKTVYFTDRPDENFVIRYRDPIEAIKTLLGDPALADEIVYRPHKVFSKQKGVRGSQIYNEMWTGNWWDTAQV
jgi:hypothetical protein